MTRRVFKPHDIERPRDDRPAASLFRFVWLTSRWHQVGLCAVAGLSALLSFAPIDLQRRIIDDAIVVGDMRALWLFGFLYLLALIGHQLVRSALLLYQSWISHSATLFCRAHVWDVSGDNSGPPSRQTETATVLNIELAKLGAFVGEGISAAFVSAVFLVVTASYMLAVAPAIAVVGLALLIPQFLIAPMLQRRLNTLVSDQMDLQRQLGHEAVSRSDTKDESSTSNAAVEALYDNRLSYDARKVILKALLNLTNGLAPLAVLVVGGALVITGDAAVGAVVAFVTGFDRLSGPVRNLIQFYRTSSITAVQHQRTADWLSEIVDEKERG